MKRKHKKRIQLNRQKTVDFLGIFLSLMENGFSMLDCLQVITRSGQFNQRVVGTIEQNLAAGHPVEQAFEPLKLSASQKTQLELAERHGNLIETIKGIIEYQRLIEKQSQLLKKMITYPLLLLVFLFSVLMGMRQFLLPQLLASGMVDQQHWGIQLIEKAPVYSGAISFLLFFCVLFVRFYFRKKTILYQISIYASLPFVGKLFTYYQTSFLALEWGKLFKQGLEIRNIVTCMGYAKNDSFMKLLGEELNAALIDGAQLSNTLEKYNFLTKEFPLIIFQGEAKGRLGDELYLYSQLLMARLFQKIEKMILWIQPIIFLLVAALIVGVYGAMFLPIYGNLEGVIL